MTELFLEILFNASDFSKAKLSRDEIDDLLNEALENKRIGEVSGGGSGSGSVIVDINLNDEIYLNEALEVIRKILKKLNAPKSTTIRIPKPEQIFHL